MAERKVNTQEQAAKQDPWKIMMPIFVPKKNRSEQPTRFVSVNGKSYYVPIGVQTMVPKPIYNTLVRSMAQEEDTLQAAEENFGGNAAPMSYADLIQSMNK